MTDVVEVEAVARELAFGVFQSVLHDQQWRTFGFRGHPRRGRMWDRVISNDRLALETFLLREFGIVAIAQTTRTIKQRLAPDWTTLIVARVLSSLLIDRGVRESLYFATLQEGLDYLQVGSQAYAVCAPPQWSQVLLKRVPAFRQQTYAARVFLGAALLLEPTQSIFPHVATMSANICTDVVLQGQVELPADVRELLVTSAASIVATECNET